MAKRTQQHHARQKKDKSGCMWGIISMFDFRHDRAPKRLLYDRRGCTNNKLSGPPYPTSEANLPTNSQEMHPTFDLMRTRVEEVAEKKIFIDQDSKPIRKHHERMNTSKTLRKAFDEEISISHQAQKTSQYHDLEALVREILLIYRKRNEQHGDLGTRAKRFFPIVEEKLIAAFETLNEKSRNGDDMRFHNSKEMFRMLSSNKEMFLKIVQDQNLILLKEDQKSRSKGQGPDEQLLTRKHRKVYRSRSKSQESIPFFEKDRIVILKPGCSENQVPVGNEIRSVENGSQLSFMKVERRLKQAMGKEQQTPGPAERTAAKMVDSGWSSPNRDHFYTERFAKITNGVKTGDRFLKSRENAENQVSNIYVEAKKHLSEMLTSGDEDAESMKRSLPESLGRILSLQECNSRSPVASPLGQPRLMVNKSQPSTTVENPKGKIAVLDDVIFEVGDQEIVRSTSYDEEHQKQVEACGCRDSLTDNRLSERLNRDLSEKNELLSSENLNDNSLATKTEEHEISPGKPSPISVLEPLFSDDDITSTRTVSQRAEAAVQPRCIEFDEFVSSAENQEIRITDSGDNEESAFEYVEVVLLSSDLNWSEFETRWISSVQILDPSLFDEVETFSGRAKYDQKLLFDSTNEALEDVCNRFIPESTFIKRNVGPAPKGMDLINEVWSRIESCLCKHYTRDMNELVINGLETTKMWLDLQTGSREVVIELEELIFEETIDDVLFSLFTIDDRTKIALSWS